MTVLDAVLVSGFNLPDTALTINRVAVGLPFAIAGFHKCFYPERHKVFARTLQECGIPCLPWSAWFVCLTEMGGGIALVAGILSPLAALGCFAIALVATVTDGLKRIPAKEPEDRADYVFYFCYLPEVCWAVMLLTVILAGPGYGLLT